MVALLDSVAVVAFLDADDAFHPTADQWVRKLAGRERLIVSVITYAELLTGAGLGHHDRAAVDGFFAELIDEVVSVDPSVAQRAAELRSAKPKLRLPDALILATADLHDAELLVTGDHRWAGVLPGLRLELLTSA